MSRATAAGLGLLGAVLVVSFVLLRAEAQQTPPSLSQPQVSSGELYNPADVIYFQGKYVASEVFRNRLAIFDDLKLTNLRHFDPASIGQKLRSPHFLAISPWGSLLITEGWGFGVVEIRDLNGNGWRRFRGQGKRFNAPHGICVDKAGWIYVGDSLNSRLVRFRDIEGKDWEVFADHAKQISYIRGLYCHDDGVWVSNSYEKRDGLNPGEGANILKVTDFASGRTQQTVTIREGNITGVLPLSRDTVLFGMWGWDRYRTLALGNTRDQTWQGIQHSRLALGVPYGIYRDPRSGSIVVAYLGSLKHRGTRQRGGLAIFTSHTVMAYHLLILKEFNKGS